MASNISNIILEETKQLPDDLLKEVLDFILFLKSKKKPFNSADLSVLQQEELAHLEDEFENYKQIYPYE